MEFNNFMEFLIYRLHFFLIIYGCLEEYCFLTHFSSMFLFYTPWKCQKTFGLLTFSGGIEMEYLAEMC